MYFHDPVYQLSIIFEVIEICYEINTFNFLPFAIPTWRLPTDQFRITPRPYTLS
jgi:hypothetical protein